MPGHVHEVQAAAAHLRQTVNALPTGPDKTAVREASERMIAVLANELQYCLRTGPSYELPVIED